jgi:hypothetical protein
MKKKYLCNKLFSLILAENSVGNNGILQKLTNSFLRCWSNRESVNILRRTEAWTKKQRNKLLEVAVLFNIRSSELALITHSYLKSKKKTNKKYFEDKFVFIKLSMASQNFIRSSMKSAVLSVLLFSKFLPSIKMVFFLVFLKLKLACMFVAFVVFCSMIFIIGYHCSPHILM